MRPKSTCLVRPTQRPDESVEGYALRMARDHGLLRSRWLSDFIGRPSNAFAVWCPQCLAESQAHWRESWKDATKPWCPVHRCWLCDTCPGCRRRRPWHSLHFNRCHCGQPLDFDSAEQAGQTEVPEVFLTGAISCEVAHRLGAMRRFGLSRSPVKRALGISIGKRVALIIQGLEVIEQWPNSFLTTLAEFRHPATPGRHQLLPEAFPALMASIKKFPDAQWRSRMIEVVGDYVELERHGLYPILARKTDWSVQPLNKEDVNAWVNASRSPLEKNLGKRSPIAMDALETPIAEPAKIRHAAALCHVAPERVRAMLTQGVIPGDLTQDPWLVIQQWMTELNTAGAIKRRTGRDELLVSQALAAYVPRAATGAFFSSVIDGRIELRGLPGEPLGRLSVSISQVLRWRKAGQVGRAPIEARHDMGA